MSAPYGRGRTSVYGVRTGHAPASGRGGPRFARRGPSPIPLVGCLAIAIIVLFLLVSGLRSCVTGRRNATRAGGLAVATATGGSTAEALEPAPLMPDARQYAACPLIKNVRVVIEPADGSAPAKGGPVELRADVGAKLHLLVQCAAPGDPNANVYYCTARDVYWSTAKVPASRLGTWPEREFGPLNIRWYKIEPERESYTNWKNNQFSFARITYRKTPVPQWANEWSVDADVSPTTFEDRLPGYGTMRYCVEVFRTDTTGLREKSVYSIGPEAATTASGIDVSVPRLSFRRDDTYVGWLFAWGNVPYVWGSESPTLDPRRHQAERFQGADCADLLTAAARKLGLTHLPYGSTYDIERIAKTVFTDIEPGGDGIYAARGQPVKWGSEGVLPGDVLLYGEHAAALVCDETGDGYGFLDLGDTVFHGLDSTPCLSTVGDAWETHTVTVVRWAFKAEP